MFKILKSSIILLTGYIVFLFNKKTSEKAYNNLLKLFNLTNGYSNDILHKISTFGKFKKIVLTEDEKNCLKDLKQNGVLVFDSLVTKSDCVKLANIFLKLNGMPKPKLPSSGGKSFEEFHEKVDSLHLFTPDLIKIKEVQDIISNQKIIKIVEAYLGAPPIISAVQAWWSTSNKISSEAASENAQMFHFDMERIKWLKFFVYINDVEIENGPHSFVLGTHLSGSMPKILRKKGYARISDSEMGALFPPNRIKSFIGKAGTAILEDTRGYHKGTPPEKGTRLILQIEYCASLFGINSVCSVDNLILSKNMQKYISENASFLTIFKNSNVLQEKI